MSEITIRIPNRHVIDIGDEPYKDFSLPYVEGKKLSHYMRDSRFQIRGIIELRKRCHILKDGSRDRLRTSYVPEPGERIRFEATGKAMS